MYEGYLKSLKNYELLCKKCIELSNNTHKRKVNTWREEYGSYIFAKFVMHSIAILKLLPNSSLFNIVNNFKVWDISSIAVLVRALIETYNVFFYLTIDEVENTELEFRFLVWHIHSGSERLRMLKEIGSTNIKIKEIENKVTANKEKLLKNNFYQSLSTEEKTKFRKGKKGISLTNTEISQRAGISQHYYKSSFKFLSSYIHTFPFSIEQISLFKADDEESLNLIKSQTEFATGYLAYGIRDFVKLFPDQKTNISDVQIIINKWLHVLNKFGKD